MSDFKCRQNRKECEVDKDSKPRRSRMRRASDPNIYVPTSIRFTHTKRHRGNVRRHRDIDDLPLPSDPYSSDEEDLSLPPAKPRHTDSISLKYRSKRRLSLGENLPYRSTRDDPVPTDRFSEYYHVQFPQIGSEHNYKDDDYDAYKPYTSAGSCKTREDYLNRDCSRYSSATEYETISMIPKIDASQTDGFILPAFTPYRTTARRLSCGDTALGERLSDSLLEYKEKLSLPYNSLNNTTGILNGRHASSNNPREFNSTSELPLTNMPESVTNDVKTKYQRRRRHSLDVNQLRISQKNLLHRSMRDEMTKPDIFLESDTTETTYPRIIITESAECDELANSANKCSQKSSRRRSLPRIPNDHLDNSYLKEDVNTSTPRKFPTPKDLKFCDQKRRLSLSNPIAAPVPIHAAEKIKIQDSNESANAESSPLRNQLQLPNSRNLHEDEHSSPMSFNGTCESGYSTVEDEPEPESPRSPNLRHSSLFRRYSLGEVYNQSHDKIHENKGGGHVPVSDVSCKKETRGQSMDFNEHHLKIIRGNLGSQSSVSRIGIERSSGKGKHNNYQKQVVSNSDQSQPKDNPTRSDNVNKPSSDESAENGSTKRKKIDQITRKLSACSITIFPPINVSTSESTCCQTRCNSEKRQAHINAQPEVSQSYNGGRVDDGIIESRLHECTCYGDNSSTLANSEPILVRKCCKDNLTQPKMSERGMDPTMEVLKEVANQILETKKTEATNKEVEDLKQAVYDLQLDVDKKDNIIKDLKTVIRLMKNLDGTFHS